jgi:uroporphyrin-III C-methyltransferase
VHSDTIALAARAEKIAVGKRCGKHSTAQRFINKRLVHAAAMYPVVVRLKGGDPMLFGRAQEEIAALETAGVRYEVVPGVTAALAASAELGISLTQRGVARSVALVTPRVGEDEAPSDWIKSVLAADAAAIYMGAGQAAQIAEALMAAGKPPKTPVAIIESASLPESATIFATLASLPRLTHRFSGPVVILIGPQYRARGQSALRNAADEESALTERRRAAGDTA